MYFSKAFALLRKDMACFFCNSWFLGNLLTGDNSKNIHHWAPNGTDWNVNQSSFTGHQAAVEDIQWSPMEASGTYRNIWRSKELNFL